MSSFGRGALVGFVALILAIQAYRPAHVNPPVDSTRTLNAAVSVPPQIESILARSCNDCHSDQTHWPWYGNVAPISWVIYDHVIDGRRHLNFSEWLRDDISDPREYTREKLVSACRELKLGRMPLFSYEVMHPNARLSKTDIQTFCDWDGVTAPGR